MFSVSAINLIQISATKATATAVISDAVGVAIWAFATKTPLAAGATFIDALAESGTLPFLFDGTAAPYIFARQGQATTAGTYYLYYAPVDANTAPNQTLVATVLVALGATGYSIGSAAAVNGGNYRYGAPGNLPCPLPVADSVIRTSSTYALFFSDIMDAAVPMSNATSDVYRNGERVVSASFAAHSGDVIEIGNITNIGTAGPSSVICNFSAVDSGGVFAGWYTVTYNAQRTARPTSLEVNLNRARLRVSAKNILVVSNSNQANAATLAAYYQSARNVPSANMLSIAPAPGVVDRLTNAQLTTLLLAVTAKINSIPNPIKVILLVGDFPSYLYEWTSVAADGRRRMVVSQALQNPAYWSTRVGGALFNGALNAVDYWGVGENPCFSLQASRNPMDPYISREVASGDAYAVFNLPLSPLSDGLAIAKQRIDEAIRAEKIGYLTWGKVLLAEGTSGNSSVMSLVEEMKADTGMRLPPGLHWYNGGVVADGINDNDPNGWATNQPGDPAFPTGAAKPTDVFVRSPGRYSYYSYPHSKIEAAGDFNYRQGAIAIFGQSYGFWPTAADFIDMLAVPTIYPLAPTPVYGGSSHDAAIDASTLRGNRLPLVMLSNNAPTDVGATIEVSGSPQSITAKIAGVIKWSVPTAGRTGSQLEADTAAQIAAHPADNWSLDSANAVGRMSRALAAFRAGAAIAAGVASEPTQFGDLDCYALYSTLNNGGSISEWALRMLSGAAPVTPVPWAWVVLGDPLYAPFRQSKAPGACKLF